MKTLIAFVLTFLAVFVTEAAVPSYNNFNTNHFSITPLPGGMISVNGLSTNTTLLLSTNFQESYTFHLDWKLGNDATALPNSPLFPWKTPSNWVAAMRTYINNGTNYLKGVGRPGVYTNTHFTSASGGLSVAGPLWFSPTNVIWELEGVEFFNPVTNECNTLLISNAQNFIIHGLTLRSTRQSGVTNDRSGVLHGAIQIAGTASRLKFDRITVTNYTRHCVTPAAGFISEGTVYEGCHFVRYGATNTADFGGIDGQAIPLLANTLVDNCFFYEGTRGVEAEGFINGTQNSFGAVLRNSTFYRISEASVLIIPDFTPANYYSILIQGNFFWGTGMDFPYAIVSRGGQRIRILDNYIHDYYTGIMLEADATINYLPQVSRNTIFTTDRPILASDSQDEVEAIYKADISHNIIQGGSEFGMYLNINQSSVANNTIYAANEKGIWLAGNTTVNDPCQNNTLQNNNIWDTEGTGLFIEATVLNTRLENNVIENSTIADYNFNGATNVAEVWHTYVGVGINTNVPGKAFHLSKGGMRLDGLAGSGAVLALGNNNDVYLTNITGSASAALGVSSNGVRAATNVASINFSNGVNTSASVFSNASIAHVQYDLNANISLTSITVNSLTNSVGIVLGDTSEITFFGGFVLDDNLTGIELDTGTLTVNSNIIVLGVGPALWELYGTNGSSFATIATDDNATGILINTNHVIITNRIVNIPLGGLQIGPSGAALTNVLYGTGTLNFPDTPAGQSSDLAITVTGAADGDVASIGVPSASMMTNGCFTSFTSNNAVWIRFSNNDLAAALNPASGTFRAKVEKFRP